MKKVSVFACAFGASVLFAAPYQAQAGAVVGATEFTQIANNIELMMQYAKQVEGVANEVKQYKKQVEALRKLDSDKLRGMLVGANGVMAGQEVLEHIRKIDELDGVLSSVGENIKTVSREGRIASDVAEVLARRGTKISPNDYVQMMRALGELQRDTYGQRVEALNQAAVDAQSDIERMNQIVQVAPQIATNVEGLGAIVQANGIMVGQLAGLKQSMSASAAMSAEAAAALAAQANQTEIERIHNREWADEWLKSGGAR